MNQPVAIAALHDAHVMSQTRLYYAASRAQYRFGSESTLVCRDGELKAVPVARAAADLLRMCLGARTLIDHARHIADGTGYDVDSVLDLLFSLSQQGLLVPLRTPVLDDTLDRRQGEIAAIAVITADRPALLAPALDDAIGHLSEHRRTAKILVVDGSRSRENQLRTRTLVDHRRVQADITYIGAAQRARIVSRLGKDSPSLTTLDTGTSGANRNIVLLLTAGKNVLMVDDDIRWTTWRPSHSEARVTLWAHEDPRDLSVYWTRRDAIAVSRESADLLSAHESLLRTVPDPTRDAVDASRTCVHVLTGLADPRKGGVRVTFAGIAGDSGMYCPYHWLFASGPTKATLYKSQAAFRCALASREVRRIASHVALTHNPLCMAGCMGVANQELLPPFMHVGSNEDGVFGQLLALAYPHGLFGHVPLGVVHDSPRGSLRPTGRIASATQVRLAETIMLLLRLLDLSCLPVSAAGRLQRCGSLLCEIGELPIADFRAMLVKVFAVSMSHQLATLSDLAASDNSALRVQRAAARAFRRELLKRVDHPLFFCPLEFRDCGSADMCFAAAQLAVRQLGECLKVWPDAWERARRFGLQRWLKLLRESARA